MDVSIKPTLEKFAEEQVKVGAYSNVSEVVNEALELLKEQQEHDRFDDMTDDELADVRRQLQIGINASERGEVVSLGDERELTNFFDDIKTRGKTRMQGNE